MSKIARTPKELDAAIVSAELAQRSARNQTGRLMAQAVADALRWVLGEESEQFNVARPFLESPHFPEGEDRS